MSQKFIAREEYKFANGAIGYRPGGPFDCLGPYAKVHNCPIVIDGKEVARRTCYASGYSDTFFSTPANTRYKGKHITGYFTQENDCVQFRPYDRHKDKF